MDCGIGAVDSPGWVDRAPNSARLHHACSSELAGSPGSSHGGPAMVNGSKLCAVIVGRRLMPLLHGSSFYVPVVLGCKFAGSGSSA